MEEGTQWGATTGPRLSTGEAQTEAKCTGAALGVSEPGLVSEKQGRERQGGHELMGQWLERGSLCCAEESGDQEKARGGWWGLRDRASRMFLPQTKQPKNVS